MTDPLAVRDDRIVQHSPGSEPPDGAMRVLLGRLQECAALDRLLDEARSCRSATLVIRGAAGSGKSALLDHVRAAATGFRVVRCSGVESEGELAHAGLHQLCAPLLSRLGDLPTPQRNALRAALGEGETSAPDPFLVRLAVLSLLALSAARHPLLCLVDDAHWLDQASLQTVAFVSRRLTAEPIAVVIAIREGEGASQLSGLPTVSLAGLERADADLLLTMAVHSSMDQGVRDRIVSEAHGNPLALLELPRGLAPHQLAGGFAIPGGGSLSTRIEHSFLRRVELLPRDSRLLLLTAAAEPVGDPDLLLRAAARLGVGPEAGDPAESAELIELGPRVRFRHPLVRSAVYHAASPSDRRSVHRALAAATDPRIDPDRRAWHRAQAAVGPDEDVALELDRSAARAEARAGLAAAAAFHERASELSVDPSRRRARCLTAAEAKLAAGAPDSARALLETARSGPLSDIQRARADVLEARIAFAVNRGNQAPPLLLKAAAQLERLDPALSRDTYLDAMSAAMFAGRLAGGHTAREVSRAARETSPATQSTRPADLLLDGLAIRFTSGYAAATGPLRRAVRAFAAGDLSPEDEIRWLWLACICAAELWDDESWYTLSHRYVARVRETGALSELPLALSSRSVVLVFAGELSEAAALVEEMREVSEVTGSNLIPYGSLMLAAWRGGDVAVEELSDCSMREAFRRGEGVGVGVVQSALAIGYNSVGRHAEALTAAATASAFPDDLVSTYWGLTEMVEAAAGSGCPEQAMTALHTLSAVARASGSEWALGVEARCRALLATPTEAEELYREAAEHLGHTRIRCELARTHLLHGEWLRRQHRRLDARTQLRTAYEMFDAMGNSALAERAGNGLRASGASMRTRVPDTTVDLTLQEFQIARLARDGLSNLDIGARLFLSPRTVEWHLGNVFVKLGISSRHDLSRVLAEASDAME